MTNPVLDEKKNGSYFVVFFFYENNPSVFFSVFKNVCYCLHGQTFDKFDTGGAIRNPIRLHDSSCFNKIVWVYIRFNAPVHCSAITTPNTTEFLYTF